MIQLTDLQGFKSYFCKEHIAAVHHVVDGESGHSVVELVSGRAFYVREAVDEVLKLIRKVS